MSKTTCVLPDKPSELIRLALSDLRKCENNPAYKIDMSLWHDPGAIEGKCSVCLAGAVMAQTEGLSIDRYKYPSSGDPFYLKYNALNYFRVGEISDGLTCLKIKRPAGIPYSIVVAPHVTNPTQFHTDMESLAALLGRHGL